MKKYEVKRKIRNEDTIILEDIMAYKYSYRDINFAIYKGSDYEGTTHQGYISIILSDNEINGLAITYGYKTIKECLFETKNIIDTNYGYIKERLEDE